MENGSFFDDPSAATAATASNSSAAGGARTPHSALPLTVPHGPTSVVRLTQAPGAGDVPDGQKSPSVKLVVCRARYRQRFAAVPTVVGFRKTPLRHWKRCRFYDFNFLWELFSFFLSFSPSLFFYAVFTSLGIPFKHLTLPPRLFAVGDVRVVGELWLRSTFSRKPGSFASVLFCGMH